MEGTYVMNKETLKLEMTLDKNDYVNSDDETKKKIKSNFLFSRKNGGTWVSRAKFPNTMSAELVAKSLGLTNGGKVGEMLSFEDQMKNKAEKAEARAQRYEAKSGTAMAKGEALQEPLNGMHDDIAFFTQPNINSSAGRAFTNQRNRMLDAWERGFEEFRKSEYYAERAKTARATADKTRPSDKGFIDRRIKEAEKTIRDQKKNIAAYEKNLDRIESGEELKRYNGEVITKEEIEEWIENSQLVIENAISKSIYYHECMDELGGVEFSKDNIKPGYIVKVSRWGKCLVTGTGKVNFTFDVMGVRNSNSLVASYAEIESIISDDTSNLPRHPFKVGDTFTVDSWNSDSNMFEKKEYKVTKVTDEKVTLKSGNYRAINRKPRRFMGSDGVPTWALGIADGYHGTVYKKEEMNA